MLGVLLGMLATLAYAQHGSWHDKYRNAEAMSCCGRADCVAVPVSIISYDSIMVEALIINIIVKVPAASVHQSEDMQSWWCKKDHDKPPDENNVRCLFYTIGS